MFDRPAGRRSRGLWTLNVRPPLQCRAVSVTSYGVKTLPPLASWAVWHWHKSSCVCVCSCEALECVKTTLQIQFPVTRLIVLTFWPQVFFLRDPRRVGVSRCVCCLQVHTCPYTLTAHHRRIHNHCCRVTKYIYSTPTFHFLLFYYNSGKYFIYLTNLVSLLI